MLHITKIFAVACVAAIAVHSAQAESHTGISDVQLGQGGTLHGQLLDRQGQPLANRDVALQQGDTAIARTRTDAQGKFAIAGLNSGIYCLQAGGQTSVHRMWSEQFAPPAASRGVMVVTPTGAVRGQIGAFGGLGALGTAAAAGAGYLLYDQVINNDHKPAS